MVELPTRNVLMLAVKRKLSSTVVVPVRFSKTNSFISSRAKKDEYNLVTLAAWCSEPH